MIKDNPKYFGLWAGCRTGKTRAAIELAEQNGNSCLVITPKSLTINFENEIKKWGNRKDYKWNVVSKETFRRDFESYKKYDGLICDEIHHFASTKSQLHKNFIKYVKKNKPKFIYGLSGTPFRSQATDAYALACCLNYKINYRVFYDSCYTRIRMGNRLIPVEKKCAKNVVEKVLKRIGRFIPIDEVIGYAPKEMSVNEYFDLTREQKKAIEDLIDIEPIVRISKESQICGGVLKSDGYTPTQYVKSEKIKRIIELANENGKIIIVCHFLLEMEMIQKNIPRAKILNGSLNKKERDDLINKAEQSGKFVLIIQADMCEGYGLKSFDLMVFYSLSWSAVSYIQMKARIIAVDKDTPVEYIHFLTKDSVEEHIHKSVVLNKVNFIAKLYEKS